MFKATIFKTAVISLSGIMDETFVAKEGVRKYNQDNAERSCKLFLTVDNPLDADVLIGIVGNRLEKTELIEESLKAGKKVLIFFTAYQDPKNTIASEQTAVADYMKQMQKRCFCAEFNGSTDLEHLLVEQLNTAE